MKTGCLEVRDHKGRLKVLIYTMRPSLGGLGVIDLTNEDSSSDDEEL